MSEACKSPTEAKGESVRPPLPGRRADIECAPVRRPPLARHGPEGGKGAVAHERIGVPQKGQCEFNRSGIGVLLQDFQSHQPRHGQLVRCERGSFGGGKPILFVARRTERFPAPNLIRPTPWLPTVEKNQGCGYNSHPRAAQQWQQVRSWNYLAIHSPDYVQRGALNVLIVIFQHCQ